VARDQILKLHPAAKVTLKKSSGGVFDIVVDGRLAYSKSSTGDFPSANDIAKAVG
jgi:predicted Rdx family selenoprotein